MTEKNYLSITSAQGIPAGPKIHYECAACGTTMPSMPEHAMACKCRNVVVDVDAGRVAVKDMAQFKAYSERVSAM